MLEIDGVGDRQRDAHVRLGDRETEGGKEVLHEAQEKAHKRWRVHMYTRNTRAIGILQCRWRRMWATACDVARLNVGSADNSKRPVMRGSCLYG